MRYVIIGGSAAGISAIEAIRSVDRTSPIELFSNEGTPFYSRVLLSYYIAGAISKEELHFRPLEFFTENKVTAHLGQRVQSVLPDSKLIRTEDGKEYPFDKLLIATGSSPKILDITGKEKKGVIVMRTIEHAQQIIDRLEGIKTACVLGGGLIGLRTGYALSLRGVKVKIIVKSSHVLSQMLDREAGEMIEARMREHGIEVRTGRDAVEILGKESVEGVTLDNGERINCQLVVIGKGVQPNVDCVSSTSIKVNEGIIADETMRTRAPDIYVAGDVAETYDISGETMGINAIWPCAFEQGRVAGLNMAGRKVKYGGSFRMNSLDFYGLLVISMGVTRPDGDKFQQVQRKTKDTYRKLVLKDGRIVGAILVGQVQKAGIIETLLKKKVNVSDTVPFLMSDRLNFADLLPLMRQNGEKFTEVEYRELTQRPMGLRTLKEKMKVIKVDEEKCTQCHTCGLWCGIEIGSVAKELNDAIHEEPRPVPRVHVEGNNFPFHCRHCEIAPCIDACPNGTMRRDPATGLVYVNERTCIACWMCVMVCPFGIITPSSSHHVAVKCDRCRNMEYPICVDVCPTKALILEEREEGATWYGYAPSRGF